jgi:CheY-like chemotaxis protein
MTAHVYKVLVADDDESVRESLCKLLRAEGYQVTAAANGAETMETFYHEQNQIDLVLVDLNMPLKNGWATLDRLLEANPSLPVLIVTGQPNQYEMAMVAGVSALVEKPVDVQSLLQLVRELLAGPVRSRSPGCDHRRVPFQFVRAAGYASRCYALPEQNITPYTHGGLNE